MIAEKPFYQSKKFWGAAAVAIGGILKATNNATLSQIGDVLMLAAGLFVGGTAAADFGKNGK